MDLGAMTMKGHSAFPKFQYCLKSYHEHLLVCAGGSYSSAEMQLVYSTAPADLAENIMKKKKTILEEYLKQT